jgi:hypothetical protein
MKRKHPYPHDLWISLWSEALALLRMAREKASKAGLAIF